MLPTLIATKQPIHRTYTTRGQQHNYYFGRARQFGRGNVTYMLWYLSNLESVLGLELRNKDVY